MAKATERLITLQDFLAMPESDERFEFVAGRIAPKMAPKYHYVRLQRALEALFDEWGRDRGRGEREWLLTLTCRGEDWAPLPDFSFVSFERLPREWNENAACPVVPELVVEVISPGQTFVDLAAKALAYLNAGVDRAWVIYPAQRTLTIFFLDQAPQTFRSTQLVTDPLFPGLEFSVVELFEQAGIPDA